MRIVLVRHGESIMNKIETRLNMFCGALNVPLTEKGKNQAESISNNEYILSLDKVYSSNLIRAYETAEIMIQNTSLKIIVDKRLRERSLGIFEGEFRDELEIKYPEYFRKEDNLKFRRDFVAKAPEGENYTDVVERVSSFLNSLDLESDFKVGIVSHMHAMRCMLYVLLGLTKEEILKVTIPNSEPIVLEGTKLGEFKLVSHLKEEILTYVNRDIINMAEENESEKDSEI